MHYLPDGHRLADREMLAALLNRSPATIRAYCRPVASDITTRRALYDEDQAIQAVRQRRRYRPRQRLAGA